MRQLFWLPALFFGIAILIFDCGRAPADSSPPEIARADPDDPNTLKVLLTRLLPRQQELYREFTAQTGIPVALSLVSPAELARRATAGELVGSTDLVIAHSMEYLLPFQTQESFQPFFTDGMSAGQVPSRYIDNEGYWTMLSRWTMAVIHDPRRVMRSEIATYPALASVPMRGRLFMAHPDSSGFPGLIAGLTAFYDDRMASVFPGLVADNLAAPAAGNDFQWLDALAQDPGKVAFVSSANFLLWRYSGDPARFEAATEWRMTYPVDADRRNIENGTVLGLIAQTPRRESAMRFIDYLLSEPVQQRWSEISMEYPVNVYAPANDFLMSTEDLPGGNYAAEAIDNQLPAALPAARAGLLER
jgi:iron(III) transport system substrate-binding protein